MSLASETLLEAMSRGLALRPEVGGFPILAECLLQGGVTRNEWHLPALTSVYMVKGESVVNQGKPLFEGVRDVPKFDRDALIVVIREDQSGKRTFPEFLLGAWQSGVIRYVADFENRTVTYFGVNGESYIEAYDAASLS